MSSRISLVSAVKCLTTLNPLKKKGKYIYHMINIQKLCILPTQLIYVFRKILTVNSDYLIKQLQTIGRCNGDIMFPVRYELYLHMFTGIL
jgi:hypothetical protein